MKKGTAIIITGIASTIALSAILCWSGYTFFKLEQKLLAEHIENIIHEIAAIAQEENRTLNNLMANYLDEDGAAKQAFAMGITGNTGRMQIDFNDEKKKKTLQKDVLRITRDTLEKMDVHYHPELVAGIPYFDSLLTDSFNTEHLNVSYRIVQQKFQSEFSFSLDSTASHYQYHTRPFIINYHDPVVYRVNYNTDIWLIINRMWHYIIAALFMLFLVPAAFVLYYRANKLQAQSTTFKEALFSNITHELKTPLSSLQLIIESAKKNKDISEEHLSFASGELNRMKLIIDKILTYGKMSKEQFALNTEIVNIDTVISEAVDAISVMQANSNGTIIYENRQKINITGDKALLVNMFTSLFDNAIKYNKNNPKITITTNKAEQSITISVADNGMGIPAEYRKKVFEPFFRVPTGNIHEVKGHGIGLSFVAQIVKLHEGNIHLSDKKDGGSIFTINLPL